MKIEKESLSTTITDKERTEAAQDENGVLYTKDWKKLIYAPEQLTSYTIKEGTKVIISGDSNIPQIIDYFVDDLSYSALYNIYF